MSVQGFSQHRREHGDRTRLHRTERQLDQCWALLALRPTRR
ncbi:DUF2630 family protein [Brevundimonas aurantiaca]|nr:DUF2630 family protein [Brevundimonas aurantiaca]